MQEPQPATPYALQDTLGPGGRFILRLARLMAILGGMIFVGLTVMSVISIVGRKTVGFVVPGDVELLQMLAAVASASFFPYCHLRQGDIKVDFFTHALSRKAVWRMDAVGSLLVGLFGALVGWRAWAGALSVRDAGETSMILAWPVWIPQAFMVPGFALLAVSGFYMFAHQLRLASRERP